MYIVEQNISLETLKKMSEKMFGHLVKSVIDIEKEIMIVDAALHADQEKYFYNRSRGVDNENTRKKIASIVNKLVIK